MFESLNRFSEVVEERIFWTQEVHLQSSWPVPFRRQPQFQPCGLPSKSGEGKEPPAHPAAHRWEQGNCQIACEIHFVLVVLGFSGLVSRVHPTDSDANETAICFLSIFLVHFISQRGEASSFHPAGNAEDPATATAIAAASCSHSQGVHSAC